MILTPENADYMDCRPPPEGPVDLERVPKHMRARMAKRRAEAEASERDLASVRRSSPVVPQQTSPAA